MRKEPGQPDVETVHYWFGGQAVATDEDGTLRFIHTDHLGSSSVATDALGGVVANSTYYPYGEHRSSTGAFGTDRDFTGQRLDGGTGLHFYNARYYDSALGRFVSPDTIVANLHAPQNWNRYLYVLGNPLKYSDPTGHNCSYWGEHDSCDTYEPGRVAPPTEEDGWVPYDDTYDIFPDLLVEKVRDRGEVREFWDSYDGKRLLEMVHETDDEDYRKYLVDYYYQLFIAGCQGCNQALGGASYESIARLIAAVEQIRQAEASHGRAVSTSRTGGPGDIANAFVGVTEMIGGTVIITGYVVFIGAETIFAGPMASAPSAIALLPAVDLGVTLIDDGLCRTTGTCMNLPSFIWN